MRIRGKDLYGWLIEQTPKPVAIKISYKEVKNQIVGVSYYQNPDGIILRQPITPKINIKDDIKGTEVTQYGFIILEAQEITNRTYYKDNAVWCFDESGFVGFSLDDEVVVEGLFYDDDSKIRPVF